MKPTDSNWDGDGNKRDWWQWIWNRAQTQDTLTLFRYGFTPQTAFYIIIICVMSDTAESDTNENKNLTCTYNTSYKFH